MSEATPDGSSPPDGGSPWVEREGALRGIRVLDLTRILAGPFCTMILADLGADVIKIEDTRGGDDTRSWGPPFLGEDAAYYHAVNRNKRALAVDLKTGEGLDLVQRLAGQADIVVENFRPGTAARLGLGYEQLSARNPRLVYASVSGYGQTGPLAEEAGYDAIAQALSGVMSVTGEHDGPPVRFGVSGADLGAGMWAGLGILAALQSRERTGRGQLVDVSLLDGQVAWLTYVASGYFATGVTPQRYGSAHPTIVPYQAFPTADGDVMVAVGNDGLWRRFAAAVGLGELAEDPRYASNPDRVRRREELLARVGDVLLTRTAKEWTGILSDAGVPAAPVQTVDQALEHPQVLAREMVVELEHPVLGTVKGLGTPIKLSGTPARMRTASPLHGQHTEEILRGLGVADEDIAGLREKGAVA